MKGANGDGGERHGTSPEIDNRAGPAMRGLALGPHERATQQVLGSDKPQRGAGGPSSPLLASGVCSTSTRWAGQKLES